MDLSFKLSVDNWIQISFNDTLICQIKNLKIIHLEIIWHIYNYFLQSLNLKINKYLRNIYIYKLNT